jgi:hypothetical protein
MNKKQKPPKGAYYPGTTLEILENWDDPKCISTTQRVFGTYTAFKEDVAKHLGKDPATVNSQEVENLPGFKSFCTEELDYPEAQVRGRLAGRIVEEIQSIDWLVDPEASLALHT